MVTQDQWQGTNFLGQALMQTRKILRDNPQLIINQSDHEKRVFAFYDPNGQKTIRLNVGELSEKLGCVVENIPHVLGKDYMLSVEQAPFVVEAMIAPTNELREAYNKLDLNSSKKLRI